MRSHQEGRSSSLPFPMRRGAPKHVTRVDLWPFIEVHANRHPPIRRLINRVQPISTKLCCTGGDLTSSLSGPHRNQPSPDRGSKANPAEPLKRSRGSHQILNFCFLEELKRTRRHAMQCRWSWCNHRYAWPFRPFRPDPGHTCERPTVQGRPRSAAAFGVSLEHPERFGGGMTCCGN